MELHQQLEETFRFVMNDEEITLTDSTNSNDITQWDSLSHVNLMFAIEEQFGIQFPGNKFAEFQNVGELKQYLENRGVAAAAR